MSPVALGAPTTPHLLAEALSPDEVAPGWTALLIVIGLGVAVWLLWRSMNTQLRKVPPSFDEPPRDGARPSNDVMPPDDGMPEDGTGEPRPGTREKDGPRGTG
ncbi:MAG: hypothetical protein ACRDYU_17100 [Actinomycetes bacterium]